MEWAHSTDYDVDILTAARSALYNAWRLWSLSRRHLLRYTSTLDTYSYSIIFISESRNPLHTTIDSRELAIPSALAYITLNSAD